MPLQEGSYERLEFLGDAVLGLATASYLFRRYPDEDEGFLTRMRTKLINGRMLTGLCARHTPLPAFAVFSQPLFGDVCDCQGPGGGGGGGGPNNHRHRQGQQQQQHTPGKGKKHKKDPNQQNQQPTRARTLTQYERMLEDVFEAFLGAIFVDQGFDAASRWIVGFLEENVDFAELVATQENDKDLLNRHYMRTFGYVPIIEDLSDTTVRIVTPGGAVISTGIGPTPRAARDAAVRNALNFH
jgi:dsRNA-specific ribonuclease